MDKLEYVVQEDLYDYIMDLWSTKEFKTAFANKNSYLRFVLDKFMKYPRGFLNPHLPIEKGHFTTWMNFIEKRNYVNKYVQDLYYFHEIAHVAFMEYREYADESFYSWYDKMQNNELLASLSSEVFIYYFMAREGLPIREKTFSFEIWYDSWIDFFSKQKQVTFENYLEKFDEILTKRKVISLGFFDKSANDVEKQIARYAKQNFDWGLIWRENFMRVENVMVEFMIKYDLSGDSLLAFDVLKREYFSHMKNGVFFYNEAKEFHQVYLENNKKFGAFTKKQASI
jgi:hypothetical protein